jgi:hypothetical protein
MHLLPEPIAVDGGWRVAETDTHYIDVLVMLFNHRVVTTPKRFPEVYDEYWCYTGSDRGLLAAMTAIRLWAETGDAEPIGWTKNGQTQEWGPNG